MSQLYLHLELIQRSLLKWSALGSTERRSMTHAWWYCGRHKHYHLTVDTHYANHSVQIRCWCSNRQWVLFYSVDRELSLNWTQQMRNGMEAMEAVLADFNLSRHQDWSWNKSGSLPPDTSNIPSQVHHRKWEGSHSWEIDYSRREIHQSILFWPLYS